MILTMIPSDSHEYFFIPRMILFFERIDAMRVVLHDKITTDPGMGSRRAASL
jgi:hypothetical protein